jgi:hypothetical protein
MVAVVAPVLQAYEVPPLAVSVAEAPAQMMPSLFVVPELSVSVIVGVGSGFTVMVLVEVAEQPLALVAVTVYVPAVDTVMAAVVAPVLQAYEVPPLAVRVAEAPAQIMPSLLVVPELSVSVIDGVGSGFTVMILVLVAEQPLALVAVTV